MKLLIVIGVVLACVSLLFIYREKPVANSVVSQVLKQDTEIPRTSLNPTAAGVKESGQVTARSFAMVLDERSFACSSKVLKNAHQIRFEWQEITVAAKEILLLRPDLDLVVLQTETDLPVPVKPGNSDQILAGDTVSALNLSGNTVKTVQTKVNEWIDSGKGYDLLRLEAAGKVDHSTPIFSKDNETLGWKFSPNAALPIKNIYQMYRANQSVVSLELLRRRQDVVKIQMAADTSEPKEVREWAVVSAESGFRLNYPARWKHSSSKQQDNSVWRSWDESSGMTIDVRTFLQAPPDLITAVEQTETLELSGFVRQTLEPCATTYSHGLCAKYFRDDPKKVESRVFYSIKSGKFYVVSIHSSKRAAVSDSIAERVISSFGPL